MTKFKKCNINKKEQFLNCFCYIMKVRFKNIKSKCFNNIISQSKCKNIKKAKLDNGRIIEAEELETVITEIDFNIISKFYSFDYEILECYYAKKDYLPKEFIDFILEKYIKKTEYKGVKGKEIEYNLEKAMFNSLYGMTVTQNIRDVVIFDNESGWIEIPLSQEEILDKLKQEEQKSFLSFSWGIYVTAYARYNLLINVFNLDKYVVYCDTDSIKLKQGYSKNIIEKYNKEVEQKIIKASQDLNIPIEKFAPKDIKGKSHMLGLFTEETGYTQFITQGAKKYAYISKDDYKIHITVSGVPKKGAKALKNLNDFKDNFVFSFNDTDKNLLIYNDDMQDFEITDYKGKKYTVKEKYGCVLIPTTYELGKSQDYANLITDNYSNVAVFERRK